MVQAAEMKANIVPTALHQHQIHKNYNHINTDHKS